MSHFFPFGGTSVSLLLLIKVVGCGSNYILCKSVLFLHCICIYVYGCAFVYICICIYILYVCVYIYIVLKARFLH